MSTPKGHPPPSAITNYYLQSVLPFQTAIPVAQFTKTKQFYKPEQFIWNNPHRTSKRMYPYYHKFKDNYEKNIKPKVEEQIEMDRTQYQDDRIRKLSQIRNQTRNRFHSRQQLRREMEQRAGSRPQGQFKTQASQNYIVHDYDQQDYTMKVKPSKSSRLPDSNNLKLSATEQTYNKSVFDFDSKMDRKKKMFTEQIMENHNKIRYHFKSRRQMNDVVNSRIKTSSNAYVMGTSKNN